MKIIENILQWFRSQYTASCMTSDNCKSRYCFTNDYEDDGYELECKSCDTTLEIYDHPGFVIIVITFTNYEKVEQFLELFHFQDHNIYFEENEDFITMSICIKKN